MPSATTADSSDSMAPSSAKAMASGSTARAFSSETCGHDGHGICAGMPPNRVPMVSTGSDSAKVASAATTTAIRMPGHSGRSFRTITMMAMQRIETAMAAALAVCSERASTSSFGSSSPGSFAASEMPRRSRSWLAKMMTAMPAVNPTVTG